MELVRRLFADVLRREPQLVGNLLVLAVLDANELVRGDGKRVVVADGGAAVIPLCSTVPLTATLVPETVMVINTC